MSEFSADKNCPPIYHASARLDDTLHKAISDMHEMSAMRSRAHRDINTFHTPKNSSMEVETALYAAGFFEQMDSAERASDRFGIFMSDTYARIVKSYDLCGAMNPSQETIDGLKEQFHDLLGGLIDGGVVDGELARDESTVAFHFDYIKDQKNIIVGRRNRVLFSFDDYSDALPLGRKITVAKRKEFIIDARNLDETVDLAALKRSTVQQMIDRNHPAIIPTETRYYVKSKLYKQDDSPRG